MTTIKVNNSLEKAVKEILKELYAALCASSRVSAFTVKYLQAL